MKNYLSFLPYVFFLIACHKGNSIRSCPDISVAGKTHILFSEILLDSSFLTSDTVLAGEPVGFSFTDAGYKVNAVNWNVGDGSYKTGKSSFQLRFPPGIYKVSLAVDYTATDQCGTTTALSDTVIKRLVVQETDHSSALEGRYEGFLDSKPGERFIVTISYWKLPGDAIGDYFLKNYVNGCTGDNIDTHVPAGTGYRILYGYKSFSLYNSYPCNQPGSFKGHGTLNNTGDSITIAHFGYNNAMYVAADTIPRWHTFKGKRI